MYALVTNPKKNNEACIDSYVWGTNQSYMWTCAHQKCSLDALWVIRKQMFIGFIVSSQHAYIHTYIHSDRHTYTHTCMHTYIYTYIHTYRQTGRHKYIHTNIHTYIPTCKYTYIHTYIPTCKYTYIHTYIHTCIHVRSLRPRTLVVLGLSECLRTLVL